MSDLIFWFFAGLGTICLLLLAIEIVTSVPAFAKWRLDRKERKLQRKSRKIARKIGTVTKAIRNNRSGVVEFDGQLYRAINNDYESIPLKTPVEFIAFSGRKIVVRRIDLDTEMEAA